MWTLWHDQKITLANINLWTWLKNWWIPLLGRGMPTWRAMKTKNKIYIFIFVGVIFTVIYIFFGHIHSVIWNWLNEYSSYFRFNLLLLTILTLLKQLAQLVRVPLLNLWGWVWISQTSVVARHNSSLDSLRHHPYLCDGIKWN